MKIQCDNVLFLSMLDFSRKGIVCFMTQENINKIPTGVKLQFLWVETLETTVLNSSTKKKPTWFQNYSNRNDKL